MEKELKISELAGIWGASVPTTWNRVRKEGLSTVKKVDENKKEVTYVLISDVVLKKYIINPNNNINNTSNNRYYEDMLTDNNDNNNVNNPVNIENSISASELFDRLTTLNKEYNEHLQRVNEELITAKSKMLLLEDKAGREGYYVNEINTLKANYNSEIDTLTTNNNKLKKVIYVLLTVIVVLALCLTGYFTYNFAVNTVNENKEPEIEQVAQPPVVEKVTQKPVAVNKKGNFRR